MKDTLLWKKTEDLLDISIKGDFFKSIWFTTFGEIQKEIFSLRDSKIVVDMTECNFVSPTPFLSLLLTLKKAKVINNCLINIYLPLDNTEQRKKFLNYCANEGFLKIINDISEKQYDISLYKKFNLIGTKDFEKILDARILKIETREESVQDNVSRLLGEINESNLSIGKSQKLYMLIAIRNILQELIDNVDKHAYESDSENKFYAVYIRMRYVTDNTINRGNRNNTYDGYVPRTKPEEIYVHKAIEVYFQDIGIGIIESYVKKKFEFRNFKTRPLREVVEYTFFRKDFESRLNNTPITGLAFLRKILKEKNNYFSVYNQYEGAGAFGIKDRERNVNNVSLKDFNDKEHFEIEGQIYNFTLFDRENIEEESIEKMEDLLQVYQRRYKEINPFVLNLRRGDLISDKNSSAEIIYLLMPEYLTKNVILKILRGRVKNNKNLKKIIITDVKDEELVLFKFTLEGLYKEQFTENYGDALSLNEIYIVSKSLKIRYFILDKNRFKQRKIIFREFNSKFDYLYTLKAYESKELAKILENQEIGKYILTRGKIKWSAEQEFTGFINFDMLTSNDICFDLLHRNLERIMPIVGGKKLYAIDSTVEGLVNSINCFRNNNEIKEQFGVGSVFVSGTTLQSSDFVGNVIHFFSRGIGERMPALFFDPVYLYKTKKEEESVAIYKRIGKSSRIRLIDKKEKRNNINSYLNEKETYKILHQYAYSSVLCGHLAFEKRHDLLSINLDAIMYDQNTRLKEYVEKIIKYSLGHYIEEELGDEKYFSCLLEACMIVYPYNQLTSSVLKRCDINEEYRKYIVSLSPTNITKVGEDLEYSPCFVDYISVIIEEYKKRNPSKRIKVIIFDTLSYSGRTKQDIFEFINSIEEKLEVYFVNIIDAKVNHYPKPNNFLNYMNVNIPLLGDNETCKMCLVLNKLENFKVNIIDAAILSTIENIQETWKVQDIRNCNELIKLPNFDRIYAENIVSYDCSVEYKVGSLYFVNALPLYIYITNKIKLENDFYPMEFVMDNYKEYIGNDSLAYILSLFLLEYGDNIYHSFSRKICNFLFVYMKANEVIEVGQLSVIAILSLNESKIQNIVMDYLKKDNIQISLEGQIILLYFLNKYNNINCKPEISFLYNKMKSGNNRLDLYKQFHCQLKNTNGNVHNSPLKRLIDESESSENIRLAIASLSLLEQTLKRTELSFDMLYEDGHENSQSNERISEAKEKCLKNISEIKNTVDNTRKNSIDKEKLNEIFEAGQILHKSLFAPFIIKSKSENRSLVSINNLLSDVVDKFNDKNMNDENRKTEYFPIFFNYSYDSKISISNNVSVIYFIWNNMLVKEIKYLLDNVIKFVSDEDIIITEDGTKASGEVSVVITSSNFIINVYNNTSDEAEDIKRKAKQRYQKEVLRLLGVKFEYCRNGKENATFKENAIVTRIIIPNIQNGRES